MKVNEAALQPTSCETRQSPETHPVWISGNCRVAAACVSEPQPHPLSLAERQAGITTTIFMCHAQNHHIALAIFCDH